MRDCHARGRETMDMTQQQPIFGLSQDSDNLYQHAGHS